MSESYRDHSKLASKNYRNSNGETERHDRKRSYLEMENIDAKVYVGNVSTEKISDEELLDFFKPFGKISDIRVFKDYIFVQYNRTDDAKRLIKEAQRSLILKGRKLDILPARHAKNANVRSSSMEESSKRRIFYQHSSNRETSRKRFTTRERSNFNVETDRIGLEVNDRMDFLTSKSESRRVSHDMTNRTYQAHYSILTGPKSPNDLVDCQIIIVNARQRVYAEEIESRLCSHGLITSIILLREDYTLTEAIENAARLQCLYGIIAMPVHEERRTASFHILFGQTEEHRNLTLEDGIHIIITNFISYKERLHNEELHSYNETNHSISYRESISSPKYLHQSSKLSQADTNPPILTFENKLPLPMLLCLLADGRQLTLDEIDRILIYLIEKKAKMLTLPPGTLPPLPAQYATMNTFSHQTGSGTTSDTRMISNSSTSFEQTTSSSTEVPSTIAEQIRQILSTNIIKTNTSTGEIDSPSMITKPSLDNLSDIVKVESTHISQPKNNITEPAKEYIPQKAQSSFSHSKAETMLNVSSSFNYTSPSVSTTESLTSFGASNFSSYNAIAPSLTLNSALKPTTSVTLSNFASPSSQYFYPIPPQNVYQSPLNSTSNIFPTYSQFNVQPTATHSIVNQQINTRQQQMRK